MFAELVMSKGQKISEIRIYCTDTMDLTIVGNAKHLKNSSGVSINKRLMEWDQLSKISWGAVGDSLTQAWARQGTVVTVCAIICIWPRGMRLSAVVELKILQMKKQLWYTSSNKVETYQDITYFKSILVYSKNMFYMVRLKIYWLEP